MNDYVLIVNCLMPIVIIPLHIKLNFYILELIAYIFLKQL
jgi:hypothetical protein